jgi:hypothetical protein
MAPDQLAPHRSPTRRLPLPEQLLLQEAETVDVGSGELPVNPRSPGCNLRHGPHLLPLALLHHGRA